MSDRHRAGFDSLFCKLLSNVHPSFLGTTATTIETDVKTSLRLSEEISHSFSCVVQIGSLGKMATVQRV